MIPTIDLSNLAALGGFIAVIKAIWTAIANGTTWLANKSIIVLTASKVWATAFFSAILVGLLLLLSNLLSMFTAWVGALVVDQLVGLDAFDFEFGVIDSFFSFQAFFGFATWAISFTFSVLLIQKSAGTIRQILQKFHLFTAAFKT